MSLRSICRSHPSGVALVAALVLAAGCDAPGTATGPAAADAALSRHGNVVTDAAALRQLAEVRNATAGYNDVSAAVADGYVQFSPHVPGMGIHFLTGDAFDPLSGSSTLDGALSRTDPEILVYVDDGAGSAQRRLVAVEYAIPKAGDDPPSHAVNLFDGADADDWHVHPSQHDFEGLLSDDWTIHGECHYEGGIGIFLAEAPNGDFVHWVPVGGGTVLPGPGWDGTPVTAADCPPDFAGGDLLVAHGKWWTLHVWAWQPNPAGVFHPTNPRISP